MLYGSVAQQNIGLVNTIIIVDTYIAIGMQQAVTIVVGNLIGANQVPLAKRMTLYTLQQLCLIGSTVSILLYVCRGSIIGLFTNDGQLDFKMAEDCMVLVAGWNIIAGFWFIFLGCYRALGI